MSCFDVVVYRCHIVLVMEEAGMLADLYTLHSAVTPGMSGKVQPSDYGDCGSVDFGCLLLTKGQTDSRFQKKGKKLVQSLVDFGERRGCCSRFFRNVASTDCLP